VVNHGRAALAHGELPFGRFPLGRARAILASRSAGCGGFGASSHLGEACTRP